MYVVIGGGGIFGGGLARRLVQNRHDVVVVERDRSVCEQIAARVGALAINGTATSIDTLEEAGIKRADVAVGAMPTDADNLAFGVLARNFGVPRVIARMRNSSYESAYEVAGVSRALNMSEMFVSQVVLEIEQPALHHVATFGRGRASIVVSLIPDGALVNGKSVSEIARHKDFPDECVIAGIFRQETEEFVFPRGSAQVRSGDQIFLAANMGNVRKAAEFLRRTG